MRTIIEHEQRSTYRLELVNRQSVNAPWSVELRNTNSGRLIRLKYCSDEETARNVYHRNLVHLHGCTMGA